jgi:hypothetical protein
MRTFRRNWNGASTVAELKAPSPRRVRERVSRYTRPRARSSRNAPSDLRLGPSHLDALRGVQRGKDPLPALLAMAEASVRLEDAGRIRGSRWRKGSPTRTALGDAEKRMTNASTPRRRAATRPADGNPGRPETPDRLRGPPRSGVPQPNEGVERHSQSLHGAGHRNRATCRSWSARTCDRASRDSRGRPAPQAEQKFSAREAEVGITRESRQKLLTLIVADALAAA